MGALRESNLFLETLAVSNAGNLSPLIVASAPLRPPLVNTEAPVYLKNWYRYRGKVIPAGGWLVLRRVAGKRLPQHSEERKVGRVSVQTRALSVAWSFGFEIGQDPGRIVASEATNGKSRKKRKNK